MKMNRRNVVIGLGTVVAGGGAALGSGAFSTAEAQRTLEVNVVDDANLSNEFVDILLQPGGFDSVDINGTATNLFPNNDGGTDYDNVDEYNSTDTFSSDGTEVSLIANEVTIVFGTTGNELPPNSAIEYKDLFRVVNEGTNTDFKVTFETGRDELLNFQDYDTTTSGAETFDYTGEGVGTEAITSVLNTEGSGEEIDELTIKIEDTS